jgi:hypothetical protein
MATTTPNYGWDVPTSTDYVKDGATAIETLGDDIDATLYTALGGAYPGLRLVKTQAVGSGVASVTVTNAFSATYRNYRIIMTGGTSSGAVVNMNFVGSTASYFNTLVNATYATATPLASTTNNGSRWQFCGFSNASQQLIDLDVFNPFATTFSHMSGTYVGGDDAGRTAGVHKVASSYTDFTLTPAAGTLTGGTIYVYGYGVS